MLSLCFLVPLLAADPALGHWRAALGPVETEVPFDLVLALKNGALCAEIRNGEERLVVPEVVWRGSELVLGFPHYDSRITATLADDGKTLSGEWKKRSGKDKWTALAFRAAAGDQPRFPPAELPRTYVADFEIAIMLDGRESRGVLSLVPRPGEGVGASVRLPTGDLRYLAGTYDGRGLRLSEFDGSLALRFEGTLGEKSIDGTCRMGGNTGIWSARPTASDAAPDGFAKEPPAPRFPLAALAYSDVSGAERALAEPLFEGKPMLIALGGSWCPNCHDEMQMLAELDAFYGPKGLSITELCFEYSGDFQRDALQARRMAERHGAKFRVLLGGGAGKGEPSKAFPVLGEIKAYPTTLFVRRDGTIAALHEGFCGPATGKAHAAERAAFEQAIQALLASPAPSSDATWTALLANPLRDERDGLFLTVRRGGDAGSYEAEELTRFDGPTRQGVVEQGEVRVRGNLVRLGKTLYRYDAGTATFQDPFDFAHRLVNAVRPHLPMRDGQLISDADDLATKLVSDDSRWRAEARYHLTKALQSMQAEPRYETWRGIDDEDPWAACAAVWSAGELGRAELCEGIAKLLEHPFAPLRHEAVRALGALGYAKAQEAFARMAGHDLDGSVRAIAANPPKPQPPPGPPDGEEKH